MSSCSRNLGPRGPAPWWLLLSAGLMLFLLYILLLQEPSTTPARLHRGTSPWERSTARPLAPTRGGKMPSGQGAQEKRVPDPRTTAVSGHASASRASPSPERKETGATKLPAGGRAGGAPSEPTEAATVSPGDPRGTRSGRWTQQPSTQDTEPTRALGKAATKASTPAPGSQDRVRPTMGARLTGKGRESRATEPPKASAQPTLASGPARSPKTAHAGSPAAAEEYSMDAGRGRTTCPDSLKVKAAKSQWLRSLFLPNLTLFLDSDHFSPRDWERLRRFNPPFGFLDLNRSLVERVVTRFPPRAQQLLLASLSRGAAPCVRCAVVGNGGSMNGSRKGREIDSHDYVFRVNGALTRGYEQDVGTRTSFYGFTAFSLTQSLLLLGRRGFTHAPQGKDVHYLHFVENSRDYTWLEALLLDRPLRENKLSWFRQRPREAFPADFHLDRYHLLHPDALRYMRDRYLRSKTLDTVYWRIYRPTTGAFLLLTALQLCDQVSAYGFITEGHRRFSDHYYDTSWKKTVFYINHDFNLERDLWKRLHAEGVIRLYQRP